MAVTTLALYISANGYLLCERHAEQWAKPKVKARGVRSRVAVRGVDYSVLEECVDCFDEAAFEAEDALMEAFWR
ncbi:MAG: hypothetical protein WA724_03555 [Candidatus Dormiibacterota bacterium]